MTGARSAPARLSGWGAPSARLQRLPADPQPVIGIDPPAHGLRGNASGCAAVSKRRNDQPPPAWSHLLESTFVDAGISGRSLPELTEVMAANRRTSGAIPYVEGAFESQVVEPMRSGTKEGSTARLRDDELRSRRKCGQVGDDLSFEAKSLYVAESEERGFLGSFQRRRARINASSKY